MRTRLEPFSLENSSSLHVCQFNLIVPLVYVVSPLVTRTVYKPLGRAVVVTQVYCQVLVAATYVGTNVRVVVPSGYVIVICGAAI